MPRLRLRMPFLGGNRGLSRNFDELTRGDLSMDRGDYRLQQGTYLFLLTFGARIPAAADRFKGGAATGETLSTAALARMANLSPIRLT